MTFFTMGMFQWPWSSGALGLTSDLPLSECWVSKLDEPADLPWLQKTTVSLGTGLGGAASSQNARDTGSKG